MSTLDYGVNFFKSIVNEEYSMTNTKKLNEGVVTWEFSL